MKIKNRKNKTQKQGKKMMNKKTKSIIKLLKKLKINKFFLHKKMVLKNKQMI